MGGGGENRALATDEGRNVSDQFNITVNHISLTDYDFNFKSINSENLKDGDYIEFEAVNTFIPTESDLPYIKSDILKKINADFIKVFNL